MEEETPIVIFYGIRSREHAEEQLYRAQELLGATGYVRGGYAPSSANSAEDYEMARSFSTVSFEDFDRLVYPNLRDSEERYESARLAGDSQGMYFHSGRFPASDDGTDVASDSEEDSDPIEPGEHIQLDPAEALRRLVALSRGVHSFDVDGGRTELTNSNVESEPYAALTDYSQTSPTSPVSGHDATGDCAENFNVEQSHAAEVVEESLSEEAIMNMLDGSQGEGDGDDDADATSTTAPRDSLG